MNTATTLKPTPPSPTVVKPPTPVRLTTSIPTVFLAGTIEQGLASDWQAEVTAALNNKRVLILNPRRDHWDPTWKQERNEPNFRTQVLWELNGQERADIIAMYFEPQTRSPISLLELGLFARTGKLIVCCPEGFWRKGNVDLTCERYGIRTTTTLEEFKARIAEAVDRHTLTVTPGMAEALTQANNKKLPSFAALSGRVGILGGTFDPPHLGHLALAEAMKKAHNLDAVVLVPARRNPLKTNGPVASDDARLDMTALLVRNTPGIFVSNIQQSLPEPSYTVDLLRSIHDSGGEERKLFMIVGADAVASLHQWKEIETIASMAQIVVSTRPGYELPADIRRHLSPKVAAQVETNLTETHTPDLAATGLRALLQSSQATAAESIAGLDLYVMQYARQMRIYHA